MQWQGKIVVITGASSGIGAALAHALLDKKSKVAVCARNLQTLEECYAGVEKEQLLCVQADVSSHDDCKSFVNAVIEQWGSIDVLINNAGMSMRATLEEVDVSVIARLMNINFMGSVYMTKYSLPYILSSKGSIVGVSSIAGYRGLPARSGYSASKFALNGFLESLRTELLHSGVQVLTVSPGFTSSNIRNTSMNAQGKAQQDSPLDESKLMSAEECASLIIEAIEKRKSELIMTHQGRLTVWLNKLFPRWADKLVYKHFAKEKNSPLR